MREISILHVQGVSLTLTELPRIGSLRLVLPLGPGPGVRSRRKGRQQVSLPFVSWTCESSSHLK